MQWWHPRYFTAIGIAFFLIAFITLLSVVGQFQVSGKMSWLFVGYAAMDVLLGIGFYTRQKWLPSILLLNLAGYVALHAITLVTTGTLDVRYASVNILIATMMWGLVYSLRGHLLETPQGRVQGILFLVLWVLTYGYSLLNTLIN